MSSCFHGPDEFLLATKCHQRRSVFALWHQWVWSNWHQAEASLSAYSMWVEQTKGGVESESISSLIWMTNNYTFVIGEPFMKVNIELSHGSYGLDFLWKFVPFCSFDFICAKVDQLLGLDIGHTIFIRESWWWVYKPLVLGLWPSPNTGIQQQLIEPFAHTLIKLVNILGWFSFTLHWPWKAKKSFY